MHAIFSLTALFIAWKSLLLLVTALAPGPGYDTSTTLLPSDSKLVRWDAIYFVHKARHGDIFEQEWAFGKGISTLLSWTSKHDINTTIVTGATLSHASHLISVLFLWDITRLLCRNGLRASSHTRTIAFIGACLHIISPAGVFLSAPYAESTFSCLNMLGFWLYLQARGSVRGGMRCGTLVCSGITFGFAAIVRSNGVLSGLPFLFDAMSLTLSLAMNVSENKAAKDLGYDLFMTIIAGTCVAVGFLFPQLLAYGEYCLGNDQLRPWCRSRIPLIYSFVQSHYWGVGFLRYWTLSNLPLFLLAVPMLMLLIASGLDTLSNFSSTYGRSGMSVLLISRLAGPQVVLALLSITNYHVQIITRLSSGYPWHYIWLAEGIYQGERFGKVAVTFFIMYGSIQAGLYASFLPPA